MKCAVLNMQYEVYTVQVQMQLQMQVQVQCVEYNIQLAVCSVLPVKGKYLVLQIK